jgi:hypothetical protein
MQRSEIVLSRYIFFTFTLRVHFKKTLDMTILIANVKP